MRLLNTATLEFSEFFDEQTPKYAILSHRWGDQEVSYQDFMEGQKRHSLGFWKIWNFCRIANSYGYLWGWVDTCCIDKRSSAELMETINSMFAYYSNSEACLAYLSDVPPATGKDRSEYMAQKKAFRESEWFRRGWTLQELLAPEEVVFYDRSWNMILTEGTPGTKDSLQETIAEITGIDPFYVANYHKGPSASVAMRMSWVSRRQTTRREDMAYCLLGLFKVNMPLLYGEGHKAFVRLQLEIIKKSDDESIFAWTDETTTSSGMLAPDPKCFQYSGNVISVRNGSGTSPYSMTNKGLQIRMPSTATPCKHCNDDFVRYHASPMEGHRIIVLSCLRLDKNISTRKGYTNRYDECDLPARRLTICSMIDPLFQRRCRYHVDQIYEVNAPDLQNEALETLFVRQGNL